MKKALIGFHDQDSVDWREIVGEELAYRGYSVESVDSVDAMLEKMGIAADAAPDASPANAFDLYMMDANLGNKGGADSGPAGRFYAHARADCEAGRSKFMAFSEKAECVEDAQKKGAPCAYKTEMFDFLETVCL
jgi:hypothetical protein